MKIYVEYDAVPTIDVETGFFFRNLSPSYGPAERKSRDLVEDLRQRTANFTQYDTYCFRTKMNDYLRELGEGLTCRLDQKKVEENVNLYVRIDDGGDFYPITFELKPRIEKMVQDSKRHEGYFLLFVPREDIYYLGVCLPVTWMKSVLPFIEFPREVQYANGVDTIDNIIDGSKLYVKVDAESDYEGIGNMLVFKVLNKMVEVFQRGAIVLSPTIDTEFIDSWDLVQVYPLAEGDYRLYTPSWINFTITKSPSEFLDERLVDDMMRIEIVSDASTSDTIKHAVAYALQGHDFIFCDKHVMVTVTNIDEANEIARLVKTARVIPGSEVSYEDVHKGLVKSVLPNI